VTLGDVEMNARLKVRHLFSGYFRCLAKARRSSPLCLFDAKLCNLHRNDAAQGPIAMSNLFEEANDAASHLRIR